MVNPESLHQSTTAARLRRVARGAALFVMLVGTIVLFGWALQSVRLTAIFPGWVPMRGNTAFCFILAGGGLLAVTTRAWIDGVRQPGRRTAICGLALLVLAFSLLTEVEYLFGVNLQIDELLFREFARSLPSTFPGRMAPTTAFNFTCSGLVLLLLALDRAVFFRQVLAGAVTFVTLVVINGTAYGLLALYQGTHATAVALLTNLCFLVFGIGLLCANGTGGMMNLLADTGSAGTLVRRLLPTAIVAPLLINWLCASGEQMGLFSTNLGISIFSVTTVLAFGVVAWRSALTLQKSEREAIESNRQLRLSAERYTFLAEAMPQIVWTAAADGNVDYFNQRWIDYTGLSLQQARDWGWQPVIHPEDLPNCLAHWKKSLQTGCGYEVEYRFKRGSDGAYRWHLGRAFPLRNEAGEITQWVGTCTDIHEQKQARADLERSVAERTRELVGARERLQAVMDAATHVSIVATNPEGLITVFNRGAEQMLGYTAAEMVGLQSPAVFHLESEVLARGRELTEEFGRPIGGFEVFTEKAQRGEREEREWTYVRKDGTHLTVNLIITASRDGDGRIVGYLGIATDITARQQAEKTLRDQALILNLANDAIFVCDLESRIIYWNHGSERLYGWKQEAAVGRVAYELLHTQFPQPLKEIKAKLLAEGHWEGEMVKTTHDGAEVMVASNWTLQRDEAGRPVSIIKMNYDISARKKAERELEKSRERLNTILYSSLDGVILYEAVRDPRGILRDLRFMMINPAAEKLMRQDASELIGHTLLEKFPSATADGLFQKLAGIVEGAGNREFDHLSRRTEPHRWFRIAGVKLGDGLVISYTEITARKNYEQQLQKAKESAEMADRAKSDFLANMSHEIRTPMNGVIGMTGLLLDTRLDAEQRSLADTIRTSAESLLHLINDILDFSKIEAGKLSMEEIDFDLRKVLEKTLEMMAGQAQGKGVELMGSVAPGLETRLRGDPGRVQQVLTNLIGNALKFTKVGEVAVRVAEEEPADDGVCLRFEVRDTGIGISAETQRRLFQPFVQADSSTSRRFGGTGLGLAICKRLVESMEGTIGVKSERGEGSIFWFTVKFARQADAAAETSPELEGARILVVDDNRTMRDTLQHQLAAWRAEVGCAADGTEALTLLGQAAAKGAPYAAAIIDLQMPTMNGFRLAQTITADPILRETKIILLTPFGKSIPEDDLAALKIAAACVKPVRLSVLFDSLALVLNRTGDATPRADERFMRATGPLVAPLRNERVLLAEDNTVNQHVALGNLRKLGYQADIATNGMEVIEALETKPYDIILMDCQMPELDGYEATRHIRQRERRGHRPWIIAMTANVMVGDREKCLAAGMDDYVSKPLRRAELRAAMERASAPTAKPYDEAFLRRQMEGDDETASAQLVELFATTAPTTLAEMRCALEKKTPTDLAMAAHTLKGSAGNLGAFPLAEICAKVECLGRDGSLEGAPELVGAAEKELHRLVVSLRSTFCLNSGYENPDR